MIYKAVRQAVGGATAPIPIEHLFTAIEYMLISSRMSDSSDFILSLESVNNAIINSNMIEFSSIFK
ncbi:hypothetical protein D3C85_1352450 [compost metagenome]